MLSCMDSIFYEKYHYNFDHKEYARAGPILESKGVHAIFQKKGKKRAKKGKIFQNLGKNVQNLKFCW